MVRCAKCRNTWHLTPPEDALAEAEEVRRLPRYIPGMDVSAASGGEKAAPAEETFGEERSPLRATQRNLPAVRPSNGRQMTVAWAALAGALIVFLGILIGLRGPIARSIPAMAGFYDAVGLGENRVVKPVTANVTAADALAFVDLGLKMEAEGGVPVLTVTGQIRNGTQRSFALPPIKATLLDGSKRALYSWDFEPPAERIGPSQSLAFSSRLSNPPAQVREAVLTFLAASDQDGR